MSHKHPLYWFKPPPSEKEGHSESFADRLGDLKKKSQLDGAFKTETTELYNFQTLK